MLQTHWIGYIALVQQGSLKAKRCNVILVHSLVGCLFTNKTERKHDYD